MPETHNINKYCRLCLEKENVNVSIFEHSNEEIRKKISTCLPVTISATDNLPKKICTNCVHQLDSFYLFFNGSIEAEKQLTVWFSEEKTPDTSLTDQMNFNQCINNNKPLNVKEEVFDSGEEIILNRLRKSGCDISYTTVSPVSSFSIFLKLINLETNLTLFCLG